MTSPKSAIPTKANLESKPQAIVIRQFLSGALADTVAALEFEWFETDAGRIAYYDELTTWAPADVTAKGDVLYAWAEVLDTATMKVGRVGAAGKSPEWEQAAVAEIVASPGIALVAPDEGLPAAKTVRATSTGKTAKKGAVKPRKASAAAAVVKGEVAVSAATPTPKVRVPRKTAPAAAVPAAPEAGGADARKVLKARLAAKKAEVALTVETRDHGTVVLDEIQVVQPSMGLARMRRRF